MPPNANGVDQDIYYTKPDSIEGILKIDSADYALVQWTDPQKQAYLPYSYVRAHYPEMILNFYTKRVSFKRYVNEKNMN